MDVKMRCLLCILMVMLGLVAAQRRSRRKGVGIRDHNVHGAILVVMEDFGEADFDLVEKSVMDQVARFLPGTVNQVRSGGPDTATGLASLLFSKFPSELKIFGGKSPIGEISHGNLLQVAHDNGVKTGFFGSWMFGESILAKSTDSFFESRDFSKVKHAAEQFANTLQPNDPFLMVVSLPRIDASVDFGLEVENWNPWGLLGVYERSSKAGGACPDTFRGNERYERRYRSCPRHMYQVNRAHELHQISLMMEKLGSMKTLGEVFVALTSTCGGESEQVDGHSRPLFRGVRGQKRSLYDGGLRIPFRYGFLQSQVRRNTNHVDGVSISSVDVGPTIAGIFSLESELDSDGILFLHCINGEKQRSCDLKPRKKLLRWEWRFTAPGHCMHESPRFALLRDQYKMLFEPGSASSETVELYDLSLASFEKNDLMKAIPGTEAEREELKRISESMKAELIAWIDALPDVAKGPIDKHLGCNKGAFWANLNAPQSGIAVPKKKQNNKDLLQGIVFILADDMGMGDISKYRKNGHPTHDNIEYTAFEPSTPDFDRIMEAGVVATNFYCNSPVCSPSRAAFITGRLPSHRDVRFHNIVDKNDKRTKSRGTAAYLGDTNPKHLTTMTKFFHDQGFVVGHFGKWHLGYRSPKEWSPEEGERFALDEYQIYGSLPSTWKYNHQFPTATKPHNTFLNNKDFLFASYAQEALVNRTIEFLQDRVTRSEKFFVQLWLQNPHAPLNLATSFDQPAANGFPGSDNPLPNRWDGNDVLKMEQYLPLQIYRTLLRDQEIQVAKLIDRIDALGISEKTVIVYTADNGPEERTVNFATVGSANPFRGRKRSLFEGVIRVPFFALWKNHFPTNRVITAPMSGVDLFPTFASLAGLRDTFQQLPDFSQMQGMDLSCLFLGGECANARSCGTGNENLECVQSELVGNRSLFFEFRDRSLGDCLSVAPRIVVRRGRYKLLWEPSGGWYPSMKTKSIRLELYDLETDPLEFDNLLFLQPGNSTVETLAEDMRNEMVSYIQSSSYDKTKTPSRLFGQTSYEMTFTHNFAMEGECSTRKTKGIPSRVSINVPPSNPCPSLKSSKACKRRKIKVDGKKQRVCDWKAACALKDAFTNDFV